LKAASLRTVTVKKALRDRQAALGELVDAIRLYRELAADYAQAVARLNAAVARADGLLPL
jgi:hypothetical protein